MKFLKRLLAGLRDSTNVKRAARGFAVTFLTLFVPGLLGWLTALTAWAPGEAFPDLHVLGALALTALIAACVGLVNLAINALETALGKGFLRDVPSTTTTDFVNSDPHLKLGEAPTLLAADGKFLGTNPRA